MLFSNAFIATNLLCLYAAHGALYHGRPHGEGMPAPQPGGNKKRGAASADLLERLGDLAGIFDNAHGDTGDSGQKWMNDLPNMYRVSNSDTYETAFRGEYFEVLSETISLDYAEVFWAPMAPIPIPVDTNKLHITGYEMDIVRELDDGSTEQVAEYEIYNHHLVLHFRGTRQDGSKPELLPRAKHESGGMHGALFRLSETETEDGETIGLQSFVGAEQRGTFAYTPKGYAWTLDRPEDITIEAMLINVGNNGERCDEPSDKCPMPRTALASHGHNYSPLLECPCTDRIRKEVNNHYFCPGAQCERPVSTLSECVEGSRSLGFARPVATETVNMAEAPYGCMLVSSIEGPKIYFNEKTDATGTCPQNNEAYSVANVDFLREKGVESYATILETGTDMILNMTGPADKWFAYGFPGDNNWGKMDGSLAFVALTDGTVTTRRLGDHNPGEDLGGYRTTVVSNDVADGMRTVVLSYNWGRMASPIESAADAFAKVGNLHQRLKAAFGSSRQALAVIGAVGRSEQFGYHGSTRGSVTTHLIPYETAQCIGRNDADRPVGTINGVFYDPSCSPQLLAEGNPICDVQSYPGGQLCCAGGTILLDSDQSPPEGAKDNVKVKLRVYYEDGEKMATQPLRASQRYYAPEGDQAEYHIPAVCDPRPEYAHGCFHVLEETNPAMYTGIAPGHPGKLVMAQGHCHTPMCISQELWNADTGELLCSTSMDYGRKMDVSGDEAGYITGSTVCLWGDDDGLADPPVLTAETRIMTRKVANSTYAHYGDMAGWVLTIHDDTL